MRVCIAYKFRLRFTSVAREWEGRIDRHSADRTNQGRSQGRIRQI